MELQKLSASQIQTNVSNTSNEIEKQDAKPEKPQLKEHCSSKAANALRGVVMGLALAAGVTAGAKAMPVQAAENQPVDNTTSVSEEQEASVQKTDVEMAVDELLDEQESTTTTLHVGDMNGCVGKMTYSPFFGGRNYDSAKITREGNLVFYRADSYTDSDGHTQTSYHAVNSFNLETETKGNTIELQTGSRFGEVTESKGDYVELAEDGRTFVVYDKDGKEIGQVTVDTPETYKFKAIAVASAIGAVGLACAVQNAPRKRSHHSYY